ncbi:hypothetical protein C8F04DRAFT_1251555 [Mycena alexandri]|uniref:CxC2-like cysteine cluster KDZ transposase-associated domain-containing protein n=1 Tax=Mycena alexandri TaxID=1745969 RepID=A0AAD6TBP0_9AGAR|nr:hypothetical protein C8F04DRAFT_1251555 [Mycena alexandri]
MKAVGRHKKVTASKIAVKTTSRVATNVPSLKVGFHTATTSKSERLYVGKPPTCSVIHDAVCEQPQPLPFFDVVEENPGAIPAYETTPACDEKGKEKSKKIQQNVAHMNELKEEEPTFLRLMLSLHHHDQVLTPSELLCRTCWAKKHRTMWTHWAFVWNKSEQFFEKHDSSQVVKNGALRLGHCGDGCPKSEVARSFTLVECNGIHATAIAFCGCETVPTADGKRALPHFQQLLQAGIFPGSVKDPKTGYTLGLLRYHRQQRSQGKGSAYNFVQFRTFTPTFSQLPRFYEYLEIKIQSGQAFGLDSPVPGEETRPYPNRPEGYLGVNCAACPERGVNMPFIVKSPSYLRHTITQNTTLDGNFKANLFFKRDDGSDTALTDGMMYFPKQTEFEHLAKTYVIPEEDKEVPCKAHIGSIRHQGSVKYGTTAVSGVVAAACDHAVLGSLVDMIKGEAFALGTYAQREHLRHTNSPPHAAESVNPNTMSYDSYCSFVINQVQRALTLFPDEAWLHDLLAEVEGQIPADHINGHGLSCQSIWQAVYFACRAHFHGETAEVLWAFLNPLGSSTRQMTGASWHDIINFVMHAWNLLKLFRQAKLLAAERLDALRLFELHMAVLQDLSSQHATEVSAWSRLPRKTEQSGGKITSVYQHESTQALTVENVLATMIAAEQERSRQNGGHDAGTPVAQWIHDGMSIERTQALTVALLKNHREHPLQETWESITTLRDALNLKLKKFRERQREIYPRLTLSALDVDEPELTAIQLPSYRMKHGQKLSSGAPEAVAQSTQTRESEIQLRCTAALNGVLTVRDASVALSAVRKTRDLDYRGQGGVTRSQRNLQKAEMMKTFEIAMYNNARTALIHLGYMEKDAVEPFPPMSPKDTRRKETHLPRAKGDSRLFDGTAWYLQSGVTISRAAVSSTLSPRGERDSDEDEPQLLVGTQTLKRSGFKQGQRSPKRLKDIAPDDVEVVSSEGSDSDQGSPSKPGGQGKGGKKGKSKKKPDGWIWLESLMRGQAVSDEKVAAYKRESEKVQWFRAEAEMYRWLEQYERKHAELMRVIERYRRNSVVWTGLGDREQQASGGLNGAVTYAQMQAAMYKRLAHNAQVIFKAADSGAHHDWVSAATFDELIAKIDAWRDVVFQWMERMGIHRAYKDF